LLIEESIDRSNAGQLKLDQVAQSIRRITGSAAQIKTLVDEVDAGSQEQARGIEQIAAAVGQMEQVTQRNAAGAEQSAAASEEMASQARNLYGIVERLRTLAGSGSHSTAQPAANKRVRQAKSPAPNTAGLAALRRSLRQKQSTPAPAAPIRNGRESFPLSDAALSDVVLSDVENNF
jgi:uncharacterized phage infection (PIP) family protein YhgE